MGKIKLIADKEAQILKNDDAFDESELKIRKDRDKEQPQIIAKNIKDNIDKL